MRVHRLAKLIKRISPPGIGLLLMLILWVSFLWMNNHEAAHPIQLRDKHRSPFAANSIWNMPIGSNARYSAANFQAAHYTGGDTDYYIITTDADPIVPWYNPGNWGVGRCKGKVLNGYLRVPADLIVPDATATETPNNAAAFLQPDGRTLIQTNPLARCRSKEAVYGYTTPGYPQRLEDIYGTGITGGHGGSGLSSIGGTIRRGELLPSSGSIRHVLKVNVQAHRYLYHEPPGYRWPAVRSDSYAFDSKSPIRYEGRNSALVMGTLLAIPPRVRSSSLKLKTIVAKQLFDTLQNYGAYIVDDSAWDAYAIAIENGVETEFEQVYGYPFAADSGDFHDDINRLFQALRSEEEEIQGEP
jgi:hypothetical protein